MRIEALSTVAEVVGDRARFTMLMALLDTAALTASELSRVAGVRPATTSVHLARLQSAGLVRVRPQGRYRYFSLAAPEVARMLESMMIVAAESEAFGRAGARVGTRERTLRQARTCHDHLAGRLGVALLEHLDESDGIEWTEPEQGCLTAVGLGELRRLGVARSVLAGAQRADSVPCLACLDWSERRSHLRGRLGRLLCDHFTARGWIRRQSGTRAIEITPNGAAALSAWTGATRWRWVVDGTR